MIWLNSFMEEEKVRMIDSIKFDLVAPDRSWQWILIYLDGDIV
jgi:hypothetical protein